MVCDGAVIRYGQTLAVDRLSFTAHRGQVVALLGPNGAGKTSTVEALEGYRRLDRGVVRVLGLDPRRQRSELVPSLGVMLQRGGLYPSLGVAQAVRLFAGYYDRPEDPDPLIEAVGLVAVRSTPWRRLSGGEQQRLALALALVGRPTVLFLDEPTAGVDPEGRLAVREIIAAQRDLDRCVVLTTHELTEAERLADHVVIVDRGRLVAEGSPAELTAGGAGGPGGEGGPGGDGGSVRFTTEPGIDTAALAAAIGPGTSVVEEHPGLYRLAPAADVATPASVASLTAWLAGRDLTLRDLRTGRSLEEAYLDITHAARKAEGGRSDP